MKSMLCEASSIIKAIESAWKQSGKPSEFTVKVLEQGEKGILWFTKQPAIVSMSYDPRKQTEHEPVAPTKKEHHGQQNAPHLRKKKGSEQPSRHHGTPIAKIEHQKTEQRKPAPAHQPQQPTQVKPQDQRAPEAPIVAIWNDELAADVTLWLRETITILQGNAKFTTTIDKKTLRVTLDQYIIPDAEENKSIYISLGNLFMQALKKKHKKKFQGFNIIITLKSGTQQNENQKSDSAA